MTRLNKVLKVPVSIPTPAATATVAAAGRDGGARVKLPKITLPHFAGNLVKWPVFWDSYESAIHNNAELSSIDKFNYLRSLLERSAYDAYPEAVEILKKRFGNKQMIIAKHMETLLNTDAITSDNHLRDLRHLYDIVETHVRSLKSLGVEATSYGSMLTPVLLTKLPPDLRLIVSRKMLSDTETRIEDVLETFEKELAARERTSNPTAPPAHGPGRRSHDRGRHSALIAGAKEAVSNSSISCCYCQQQHSATECTTVTEVGTRKQILRKSGRCFNCLRRGHILRFCRATSKCHQCRGKHHVSICDSHKTCGAQHGDIPSLAQTGELAQPTRLNPGAPPYTPTTTTATLCSGQQKSVLLQTARSVLQNPKRPRRLAEVRLLLDSGSQKSYLTERAKQLIRLEPSREQRLSIATFGTQQGQTKVCPVVEVSMRLKGYSTMMLSLYVVPTICEPLTSQPIKACVQQSKAYFGLDLADQSDGEHDLPIDMLIGADYYWELVTGSICRVDGGPTAVHTKLGWVLSGPTCVRGSTSCSVNLTTTHVLRIDTRHQESTSLDEQLRSFWELESLGIHEDKTFYDDFTTSVVFRDGRYQVCLPWKEFHEPLPDNYSLSVKRMQGLLRRLRQDPEILKEYDRIINEQLEKGIVEIVPDSEPQPAQSHYLPHHAVVRRDRTTTKLRVVYDASAKSNEPSLNNCLYKGPKFNQLVLDLLLRFRSYRIALSSDIEKAFLMISVSDKERDFLRFLWVDEIYAKDPKLQTCHFTRVVFGVSSSPFLLNATIKHHLEGFKESHGPVVKRLLESTYVDDIVSGADTEEEAFEFYSQAKELFRRGGFNLRKFVTNSKKLQTRIDQVEGIAPQAVLPDPSSETYAQAVLGAHTAAEPTECKVLGVPWNPSSDRLVFDVSELAKAATSLQPTKRNLVSLIGRFYDPLGFLAPITIRFKILFQRLCRDKLEWDKRYQMTCFVNGRSW